MPIAPDQPPRVTERGTTKTLGFPRLHPMKVLLLLSIAAGAFLALNMMSPGRERSTYDVLLAAFAFGGGSVAMAWVMWPSFARQDSEAQHER